MIRKALLFSALGVVLIYAIALASGAVCYPDARLSDELGAIARAKDIVLERGFVYFPEIGGPRGYVRALDERADCCIAEKIYSLLYLPYMWRVHMNVEKAGVNYMALVEMSACGDRISTGKIAW